MARPQEEMSKLSPSERLLANMWPQIDFYFPQGLKKRAQMQKRMIDKFCPSLTCGQNWLRPAKRATNDLYKLLYLQK